MKSVSRRSVLCIAGAVGFLALATSSHSAEQNSVRVALSGHDPVNYFTAGRPEKGSPEFAAVYDNVSYWFKSAEHRKLFTDNPDKYAPQFDGFCAIDLSRGIKTEPDPEAWTISEGKLYVFGKPRGPGIFAQEGPSIVSQATKNWVEFRKQP
jgi:YHS domain-containing protein